MKTPDELLNEAPVAAQELAAPLRDELAALDGLWEHVETEIEEDGSQAEILAYSVGSQQLCHIHLEFSGPVIRIPIHKGLMEHEILSEQWLPPQLKEEIVDTRAEGDTKWVMLSPRTPEETEIVASLLRNCYACLKKGE
jgi:hypothetical protein